MKKKSSVSSLNNMITLLEQTEEGKLNVLRNSVSNVSKYNTNSGLESELDLEQEENVEKTWDNLVTLETFNDWISVASYKIECLDLAIKILRWRLQTCILLGLILSTLSGTVSVTQFSEYSPRVKFGLNLILTITSFSVAILTGFVKTFKLQETLEEYISLKQSWVSFSAKISNEMYLPKRMRKNAETLIKENKACFLDLVKIDIPVTKSMSVLAAKHLDKGDDIESQYYKYRDNIIKKEKDMNQGCMRCLSFFYDCCYCFYKKETAKKIEDNRNLAKTIKYSKIENATKYKRRAYQYTLSSIMLNNVKNEYIETRALTNNTIATQTQFIFPVDPPATLQDTPATLQNTPTPPQDTPATLQDTPTPPQDPPASSQDPPASSQDPPASPQDPPASPQDTPASSQDTPDSPQDTSYPEPTNDNSQIAVSKKKDSIQKTSHEKDAIEKKTGDKK
jgi:hypothetical protein